MEKEGFQAGDEKTPSVGLVLISPVEKLSKPEERCKRKQCFFFLFQMSGIKEKVFLELFI